MADLLQGGRVRCHLHSTGRPQQPQRRLARQSSCSSRQLREPRAVRRRHGRLAAGPQAALKTGEVGKFISKTEIPAFIPRTDLMDQLYRWVLYKVSDPYQAAQFGLPLKITPVYREPEQLWGISAAIVKDGETATTVLARFDEEMSSKHSYVGRGSDGFPSMMGDVTEVLGANLEIWCGPLESRVSRKMDENPLADDTRACIREYCASLVAAINKYYAFGSPFVDDAT